MIGETILHYKILEKLGEGGMGIVYKAEDTTLNRNVALKFLPNYLTSDSNEKERFYHEARAAAALMHHNVAVIHEIGEHNGQVFIAMEYVEGQTLKKIIQEKSDTLTINKVLDIAIQICEGLAAAHEKAIVHRDIKSENIMLTSKGRIKLMDFGLAKISGATKLTKDGSTVGTAAYMSPEQALGEEVDNRSDIFSFGIVLYELLTTHLPFDAEHQAALVYSIINEDPQPIARFNTKVSSEIERIVFKALTKDKNERYQHIDDLLADLRKERKNLEYSEAGYVKTSSAQQIVQNQSDILQKGNKSGAFVNKRSVIISVSVTALVTLIALSYLFLFNKGSSANTTSNFNKSIAVLPFENLSSDKNNAYFASGTEDMILTKLAGIGGLKVISRTSTDRYKSQPEDLRTVAKQLGVTTVLEGSVQKSKNEVLINVQLIDAKTDSHIWAKAYTRTLDNVFDVEGEVAGKIAQALQIKLIPQETKDLHSKPTNNSQAYDLFLKAKYQIYLFHKLGKVPNAALKLYHGAIALDTTFALAYAGLSGAEQIMYELKSYNDSLLIQALLHANDAVRIDSGLAEGYFQLGSIYRIKGEYKKAKTAFDKTFKISPNDPQVLSVLALVDGTHEGLWADALKYIKKATNLDPQNINTIINYANIEFNLGNYDQSIKISNRAYRIDPDNFYAIYGMVNPLIWSGRLEQARNILKQKREILSTGINILDFYVIQYFLNIYDHKYKVAQAFADSMSIRIKKLGRQNLGIALFNLNLGLSLSFAGVANARMGDMINMKKNLKKAIKLLSLAPNYEDKQDKYDRLTILAMSQAAFGLREAAITNIKKVLTLEPIDFCYRCHYYHLTLLAQIYALYNDADDAIPLLKKVIAAKGTGRSISEFLLKNDPGWDPIRSDPRFQELVRNYSDKKQQM